MKHNELDLERECRRWARAHGWAAWKNQPDGNKGLPDDTFAHPDGRVWLVEFKTPAGRLSAEQQWWQATFTQYKVIRNLLEFKQLLNTPKKK